MEVFPASVALIIRDLVVSAWCLETHPCPKMPSKRPHGGSTSAAGAALDSHRQARIADQRTGEQERRFQSGIIPAGCHTPVSAVVCRQFGLPALHTTMEAHDGQISH